MDIKVTQVEVSDENGNQMLLGVGDVINVSYDGVLHVNQVVRGFTGMYLQVEGVIDGKERYLHMLSLGDVQRVL